MGSLPSFEIGDLVVEGIQGGMGVGVSRSHLAAAVANEGWVGTIASVGLGALGEYSGNYAERNAIALREEIRKAREMSNGVIAVNIMHALSDCRTLAQGAVEENIDMIITGAGMWRDLPNYLQGKDIKLAAIVGSGRVADAMCKSWGRLGHAPDAIIVEGPSAGGHLAYTLEQLADENYVKTALPGLISEVLEATRPYLAPNGKKIPVIGAGGIFYGYDAREILEGGASGVQMATRFVTTDECDAHDNFKKTYLNCRPEDLVIIKSPVGMPGRAIYSKFLKEVEEHSKSPERCGHRCLGMCAMKEAPYCIAEALVSAARGDMDNGFSFAGARAYECSKIQLEDGKFPTVKKIIESIGKEYREGR